MTNRRVQVAGRGVYGRMVPLKPPKKSGVGVGLPKIGTKGWRFIGLLGVIVAVGWGIAGIFAVSQIVVHAPAHQAEITVQAQAAVGNQFWRANLLLLDTKAIESKLQLAEPAIKSVEIARRLPHTLILNVTFKQPGIAWSSGNQIYTLDADGTAIAGPDTSSGLTQVIDGSNVPVKIGQRVVPRQFVTFVESLVPGLTARGMAITKLSVGDTTLDLTVETNKGYRLILDTGRAASDEMSDLDAVVRTMEAQKQLAAEYIDLRIAGKAYYK